MLKEAFEHVAVLIGMSILLDAISQFLILHEVFPGPAVIVGAVVIALPYSLARAVTIESWANHAEGMVIRAEPRLRPRVR